jgi:cytochrome c oxidase subunit II
VLASVIALLLQVQVPGAPEHRITDIFRPMATPARSEKEIALLTLAITTAIFIVVGGLICYTIYRFRRRPGDDIHQEPAQVYGSNQIEAAWTVIPILIVFVLIGVSARVIASVQNASPPKHVLHVKITGHQWWWEAYYPEYGVTTANEIHIPATADGTVPTYFELSSVDVIHSFWVPQLSGKMDTVPNRENFLWMDPRQPGEYVGNCAEYCGTQHANMLVRIVAQTPADFKEWMANQQHVAVNASSESVPGKQVFESLSCVNCHMVKGTSAVGKFGPDLTHLMSRRTIAAGVLRNTRSDLRAWIDDPQRPKPGCFMPSMKLTDGELDQVVDYLETLK